ncbi:hairy-related 6 isoform X2 [Cetorhinus maximus]
MEKRRRARINESLSQLKTLILDALKKDSSRHSKLEKADILEMTVKHLRNLQRVQMTAALSTDPTVLGKYRAGFSECMNEVTRFLSTCEGVNTEVRTRLLSHLANCMSQINAMNYTQPPPSPAVSGGSHAAFGQPLHVQLPGSGGSGLPLNGVNMPCKLAAAEVMPAAAVAAATKVYGGFQLVPASDGQFAFLIPNTAFGPNGQLTTGPIIPLYANTNVSALPSAISPASRSPIQQSGTTPAAGFPLPLSAATTAVSVGAPTDSSDSVWRPW